MPACAKTKRPSLQLYPKDWQGDMALQACSLTARGLWIEMICLAHDCVPYGHLVLAERPLSEDDLARMFRADLPSVTAALKELELHGVFSRDKKGTIFSRRMVADEKRRQEFVRYGKHGGNPNLPRGGLTLGLSLHEKEEEKAEAVSPVAQVVNRKKTRRSLPAEFGPNSSHAEMAAELGLDLAGEFKAFADFHRSKGNTFLDWDAALRTWLRNAVKFGAARSAKHEPKTFGAQRTENNQRALAQYQRALASGDLAQLGLVGGGDGAGTEPRGLGPAGGGPGGPRE